MNLSEVAHIGEDQDRGRWLTLVDPYQANPVGIRLLIAGPDSKTQGRARLKLADTARSVLKNAMTLIGCTAPEKM